MILTEENKTITSHKLARKIVSNVLQNAEWEIEKNTLCNDSKLTDSERIEICDHIAKLRHRIFKHYNLYS